jgi:hypothetical protein
MPPGLPAYSPRSFSSTGSLSSLVHHQVGLPSLSQLEQQVDSWNHPAHTPWQTKSWGRVQEYRAVVTNLDFFCSKWARHGWNSFQPQNVSLILSYWNVAAGDIATSASSVDWLPHKASPASIANQLLFTDVDDELLAMGLMTFNTDWKAIQHRYLPTKSMHQIFGRQKNCRSVTTPKNSMKVC